MNLPFENSGDNQGHADPQSALMDELLRQQDDAIQQLDELDRQILAVIKEVTDRTKAENEAAAALPDEDRGISKAA